jgi:aspartate kinase
MPSEVAVNTETIERASPRPLSRVEHHPGSGTIVKIGGSVLTGQAAYRATAEFIARRLERNAAERLVVVVSAESGVTDALLELASGITRNPDPATLDLLWSTGELRSVALLTLSLQALGVRATAVNVHQTGLFESDQAGGTAASQLRPLRLRSLLASFDVVVAPGFLARGVADSVVSLGRGGSDLTAVLLAAGLNASACELVKDVAGYFATDPHDDPDARPLPALDYSEALALARRGCDLVQQRALEAARAHGITLIVRSMKSDQQTVVSQSV